MQHAALVHIQQHNAADVEYRQYLGGGGRERGGNWEGSAAVRDPPSEGCL